VIQPIGFLCDHVEVLYDIDIAFQQTATNLGLTLIRAESLNDSGLLIDTLQDLALYGKDDSTFLPRNAGIPSWDKFTA
jgi:protoporphyrin/coproporphyrin ferrochelatase